MIPSPGVQGQKGYQVLELGFEKLDPVGLHIPVYPILASALPPPGIVITFG